MKFLNLFKRKKTKENESKLLNDDNDSYSIITSNSNSAFDAFENNELDNEWKIVDLDSTTKGDWAIFSDFATESPFKINFSTELEWSSSTDFETIDSEKYKIKDENFASQILNLIEEADFDYGNDSILDVFLREQLMIKNLQTKENPGF